MFESKEDKNMKTIESLIKKGILKFAKEPKNNPDNLNFPNYTIPLIEEDYPAKTPAMWNAVYEKLGMATRNIMLIGDPKFIPEIFDIFRHDKKYLGGGAGVGFKDESVKYLDELDPLANAIGAVNFILKTSEGKLKGFNTDGIGYIQSLEELLERRGENLKNKKIVILGAGGAGNAISFVLAYKGAKIVILNRTIERAKNLAERINNYLKETKARFGGEDLISIEVKDADIIINVSTKGSGELKDYSALAPANLPVTPENIQENLKRANEILKTIPKKAIISDIVLVRGLTPFLKSAKEVGFEILDGIGMVVNQGVEAFLSLHGEELQKKDVTKEQVRSIMEKAAKNF